MLVDTPAQRDLFPNIGARWHDECQHAQIAFCRQHFAARRRRADVDHEDLTAGQFGHFGLLLVVRLDAEQATKQEKVDFELGVDVGQFADGA